MDPENLVFVRDVEWDLKNPCDDCPFLRTTAFHQGVAEHLPGYITSIEQQSFAHTCHKTDRRPQCDGPHTWTGKVKHCAGAILMLMKTGRGMDLQLPLLRAAERGQIDLADMARRAKADKRVFTLGQMLKFYEAGLKKRLRDHRRKGSK